MMLIKTRCVGGEKNLAGEFLEMIQPFRYHAALARKMCCAKSAAMKDRMENEVIRRAGSQREAGPWRDS